MLLAARLESTDGGTAPNLEDAAFRARGTQVLVWVEPQLSAGQLQVTLDVIPTVRGFWERLKHPNNAPVHHDYAEQAVDPEIRSFFPRIPLVANVLHRAKLPFRHAEALACGDIERDGSPEVIVSDRHAIHVGRIRNGALSAERTADWAGLSPVAPAPLRQPISSLSLFGAPGLEAGSTDRAFFVRLGPTLAAKSRATDLLPWSGLGCARRMGLGVEPTPEPCFPEATADEATNRGAERIGIPSAQSDRLRSTFGDRGLDAFSGFSLLGTDGSTLPVIAARGIGLNELHLIDGRGRTATVPDAGAQVALGDLDLDGQVEIAVSRNTRERKHDTLRVLSWRGNELQQRFDIPVPGGIDAIAFCPATDGGQAPLVLATGPQLWVIG
jgi:hypothetical protein